MHARYYNPNLGRFLSADRVGGRPRLPQGWNRYAYAHGNPLKFVDPDGKDVVLAVRDNSGGGKYNYGHTAIRVVGSGYDKSYDYGRYGHVNIPPTTGDGVLRVWSSWNALAKDQARYGQLRTVIFKTTPAQDKAVMDFFQNQIDAGQRVRTVPNHADFKLTTDYNLFSNNCTTLSLQGLGEANKAVGPSIDNFSLFKDIWTPAGLEEKLEELFGQRLVMVTDTAQKPPQ
jgi:hypothetical protein